MPHILGKSKAPKAPRKPNAAAPRAPGTSESTGHAEQLSAGVRPAVPPALASDPISRMMQGDRELVTTRALTMLLWKGRHRNPDLLEKITPEDLQGYEDCINYLEIQPQVLIVQPPGAPEMPPVPARGDRPAQPGRPAEGPRPYVLVQLVDQNGNLFMPIENNEAGRQQQELAQRLAWIKSNATSMINRVKHAAQTNDFIASDIVEMADAFSTLVRSMR